MTESDVLDPRRELTRLANEDQPQQLQAYLEQLQPSEVAMAISRMAADDQELLLTCLEPDNAAGIGNLSGLLVLECRLGDAANPRATLHEGTYSDYTDYQPVNPPVPQPMKHEDRWQPQPRAHQNAHRRSL